MSATIPSNSGVGPITSAFSGGSSSPDAGVYYATPPIGEPPREGSIERDEILNTWPGVDWVGTKNLGKRGRKIIFDIIIVAASKTAVEAAANTIKDAASASARYTVQTDGGTARPGCKLVRGSGQITRWFTIGTMICANLELAFVQLSDSN